MKQVSGQVNWAKNVDENFKSIEEEFQNENNRIGVLEKNIQNPNLLINSNFASVSLVNQRGFTEYTHVAGYTIDMWKTDSAGGTDVKISLEMDCVKLESTGVVSGAFSDFRQLFENVGNIKGKKITTTIDYEASANAVYNFYADGFSKGNTIGDGVRKKESFTYTYGINPNQVFNIRLFRDLTNSVGDYIKIYSIKVELGEVATHFVDDDPATKLAKCQRYLQKLDTNVHLRMAAYGPSILYFNTISLPTRMRVVPTFAYQLTEGSDYSVQSTNILLNTGFSLSIGSDGSKDLFILANKTSHGLVDGSLKFLKPILISAEI